MLWACYPARVQVHSQLPIDATNLTTYKVHLAWATYYICLTLRLEQTDDRLAGLTGMVKYGEELSQGQPTGTRHISHILFSIRVRVSPFVGEEARSLCGVSCVARLGFHAHGLLAGQ